MQQVHDERSENQAEVARVTEAAVPDDTIQTQASLPSDDSTFNRIFNYASFMWDDYSPSLSGSCDNFDLSTSQELHPWSDGSLSTSTPLELSHSNMVANDAFLLEQPAISLMPIPAGSPRRLNRWNESQLAEYFTRSAAPPIVATVETSARWFWMRKELISMASTSRMVKFGVIAFVALELELSGTLEPATYTQYYRTAKLILEDFLKEASQDRNVFSSQIRHVLAVLFLLSYIDLLTKDVCNAHANLREGFNALQMVDVENLNVTGEIAL